MFTVKVFLKLAVLFSAETKPLDDIVESMQRAESDYTQKVQTAVESFKSEANKAKLKYVEERRKINGDLLKSLKEIRDRASKNVDLETANKAQKEIDNAEKESLEPPIKKEEPKKNVRDFEGTWEGQWDNSNELKLEITENNIVNHILGDDNVIRTKIETKNGRSLVINDKWQDFELIRKGNRLVVLGWSKSEKRHPMLTQPDHVAILFKKAE